MKKLLLTVLAVFGLAGQGSLVHADSEKSIFADDAFGEYLKGINPAKYNEIIEKQNGHKSWYQHVWSGFEKMETCYKHVATMMAMYALFMQIKHMADQAMQVDHEANLAQIQNLEQYKAYIDQCEIDGSMPKKDIIARRAHIAQLQVQEQQAPQAQQSVKQQPKTIAKTYAKQMQPVRRVARRVQFRPQLQLP